VGESPECCGQAGPLDGFVQAYNAQAAVDAHAQIIVAQDVTAVDCGQLVPMIDAVEANLGRTLGDVVEAAL
jgi:hypothetical protein